MKTILEFINKGHINTEPLYDLYKILSTSKWDPTPHIWLGIDNKTDYDYFVRNTTMKIMNDSLEEHYRELINDGKILLFKPNNIRDNTFMLLSENIDKETIDKGEYSPHSVIKYHIKKLNKKISVKDFNFDYWNKIEHK